ncbi:MAG: ATP-binding cassette domain-containing protein [Chitinispirillales bacterium]|jgi:ATP-binding cassette subfamily C protein|nr:ATP-binding cassette domain-containing protein [Chitinispirillales bacterium]
MTDDFFRCYKVLCGYLDLEVSLPPVNIIENLGNPAEEILYLSGLRCKEIILPKNWWKHSGGAMLGRLKDGTPVTILPHWISGYRVYNPKINTLKKVNKKNVFEIEETATAILRAFAPQSLTIKEIAQFIHQEKLYKNASIIILCSFIASLIQIVPAILSEEIFNTIIPGNMRLMLFEIVIILSVFELVNIGFLIMTNLGISQIGTRAGLAVHTALCDRLLHLKMPFFNRYTSGEILEKIKGIDRIKKLFIENNLKLIVFNMFVIVEIAILFKYCAPITPYVLLMFAGLIIVYIAASSKKYKFHLKLIDASNKSAAFTHQSIHAMHRIAVSRVRERVYNIWQTLENEKRAFKSKIKKIDNVLDSLCGAFKILSTAAVYLMIMNTPDISMGSFIAYISTFFILQRSVLESLGVLDTLPELMSIYKNIKPILESPPEYCLLKSVPANISGSIEFNHVTFRYREFGQPVINDVSFKIEEGECVGILGPSGSGKSTLLKLLMGLYDITSGKIYYGGYDLQTLNLRYLRKNISAVMQHSVLTVEDIYRNITGGNEEIRVREVLDIINNLGLKETIYALPKGIRTKLEECRLSCGEMQKLSVARAIARKSKFIFLDEVTSYLDKASQSIITGYLKNIPATKIIIAQRLETVQFCDKVIVLENGEVKESIL